MSIAVSVQIIASRIVKVLTLVMCTGAIGIGLAIGAGVANGLTWPVRLILAVTCTAAALLAARDVSGSERTYQIDISATGVITIFIVCVATVGSAHSDEQRKILCVLLPSSVLWSAMMILNLQAECGKVHTLLVLPDTVTKESFRSLSVACRWLSTRNTEAVDEKA